MSQNSKALQEYVSNQLALMFEKNGASALAGRIFSELLFSSDPMSLQDLADQLEVSKAAVSVQVRSLHQTGLCQKMARSQDRRDYYQISDDFVMHIMQSHTRSMNEFHSFLKEALRQSTIQQPNDRTAIRRLKELLALHELLFERLDGLEQEWEQRRKKLLEEES
ncbi:MAG: MarR family transcriptional regulator [Bacillaceae bacterium]|nr:MarR family transcriptional regulator [Bacillaceae bacterium]